MQREAEAFLWDIEHFGGRAVEWGTGLDEAAYDADELRRMAIERVLINVGEPLAQLAKFSPAVAQTLPDTRAVIGFRNVLVHGYSEVDTSKVIDILHKHLPKLIAHASGLRAELDAKAP